MRFPNEKTLKGLTASLLERAKTEGKSLEWIARETDYSVHMLYKIADLNDPSSLPLSKAIPFCRAVGNIDLILFLLKHFGFVAYEIPQGMNILSMTELQGIQLAAIQSIFNLMAEKATLDDTKEAIDRAISAFAGAKNACERIGRSQKELFDSKEIMR